MMHALQSDSFWLATPNKLRSKQGRFFRHERLMHGVAIAGVILSPATAKAAML